jgi:hypothetical protein
LRFVVAEPNRSCRGWAGVARLRGVGWPIAMKQVDRVGEERFRLVVVEQFPRVVFELLAVVVASLLVVAALLATLLAVCLEPGEPGVRRTRR